MTVRPVPFGDFDRAAYLARCRASGCPDELAQEMADEEEAEHVTRALFARVAIQRPRPMTEG